jgi:hypothetical protein
MAPKRLRRKDCALNIRVTAAEKERIRELALADNRSMTALAELWIMRALAEQAPPAPPTGG